jgi:hypothetical protein
VVTYLFGLVPKLREHINQQSASVGFEVFTAVVMKTIIFWDMTLCSPMSFNRRFGGTYRLHLQGRRNRFSHLLVRWFVEPISSTLKMEAICSSETLVETQRTTRCHIPEDDTLQSASACYLLHAGFLLGLFFDPEDGNDMFLQNFS